LTATTDSSPTGKAPAPSLDPDVRLTLSVLVAARRERLAEAANTGLLPPPDGLPSRVHPSPQAPEFTSPPRAVRALPTAV
jgi:hypothetical protein